MTQPRVLRLSAVLAAASALFAVPRPIAAPAAPSVDLKVQVQVPKDPIAAGAGSEAVVTLIPPRGIHLNRYPGIKVSLDPAPPLVFPEPTVKIGLDKMPEDEDANAFETIDPIRLKFSVDRAARPGKVEVKGKVRFFYCVKASGFCAPGTKDLAFTVPVSAAR